MPKKKFINKKKAVTFQLVHRSHQDPLAADENAPKHVLQPILKKETPEEREKRIEEQHKYGIYYNDDSNYLEYLKESSDRRLEWPSYVDKELEERKNRFALPSEVFPSAQQGRVGMLNEGATAKGMDPDIIAAMEDDFNYDDPDNQLEDDFFQLADGLASDQEMDDCPMDDQSDSYDSEDTEANSSMYSSSCETETPTERFKRDESVGEERMSNFSGSVAFKDQREILSKQLDRMLKEYDDATNSMYDDSEVQGCTEAETEEILKLGEEFFKSQQPLSMDRDDEAISITKGMLQKKNAFKTEYVYYDVKEKPKYDCQSIISTYSNTRHLPTVIELPKKPRKIKVNERTGMPENVLGQNKLTKSVLDRHNEKLGEISGGNALSVHSTTSRLTALSIRDKNENPEERRTRKKALKEYRRERREEKKINKMAFAAEVQRQSQCLRANKLANQGFAIGQC